MFFACETITHVEAKKLFMRRTGDLIEVVLSKERYRELQLHEGDQVFVTPRELRLFVQDGQPATKG